MKLLLVRHADPDYEHDSLTEKGWREAEFLARRLAEIPARAYCVSPLIRAKDTASLTLKAVDRTAEECPWLREFDAPDPASRCSGSQNDPLGLASPGSDGR